MTQDVRQRLRRVASRQNPLVKVLRRAFTQREATADGFCALEGVRLLEEAIRSGLRFRAVFFRQSSLGLADRLLPQIAAQVETVLLPNEVFDSAVATETPQGVAALAKVRNFSLEDVLRPDPPLVLVLSGIQDPGNLGTMLRSAEAFAASGVLLSEGTVSQFNAKAVRASAGSVFRVPVLKIKSQEAIPRLRGAGLCLLATSSHGGISADQANLAHSLAFFIGNEGSGLKRELMLHMDETVFVPHPGQVESLNATVAASILLYEAARQRRSGIR
jgi:RNA methyltransferase, TrmH family